MAKSVLPIYFDLDHLSSFRQVRLKVRVTSLSIFFIKELNLVGGIVVNQLVQFLLFVYPNACECMAILAMLQGIMVYAILFMVPYSLSSMKDIKLRNLFIYIYAYVNACHFASMCMPEHDDCSIVLQELLLIPQEYQKGNNTISRAVLDLSAATFQDVVNLSKT